MQDQIEQGCERSQRKANVYALLYGGAGLAETYLAESYLIQPRVEVRYPTPGKRRKYRNKRK